MKTIELLYGSILDESAFERALSAVAEVAGARGAYYLSFDRTRGAALSSTSVGVDPAAQMEYLERYSSRDIRVPPALGEPVGALVTDHKLLARDAFEASELYQDFLTRYDIPHFLALWTDKTPTRLSAFALQRSAKQGPFLKPDEDRLKRLVPHVIRAFRIREELCAVRAANSLYTEAINRQSYGVIMLDRARSVAVVSAQAERMLRLDDVIRCKNGHVYAARANEDSRLQRAIYLAVNGESTRDAGGATLTLHDSHGSRSLRVAVVPTPSAQRYLPQAPVCMLLVFDPKSLSTPRVERIMAAFQISRAEARLAAELCKGVTLREAARTLHLSVNTCKTQLKSIYARTGCRTHVELAKALLTAGLAQSLTTPREEK